MLELTWIPLDVQLVVYRLLHLSLYFIVFVIMVQADLLFSDPILQGVVEGNQRALVLDVAVHEHLIAFHLARIGHLHLYLRE